MKKGVLYTVLLLLCCEFCFAQQQVDACFSLNKSRVCVGETVTATNCIVPKGNTPPSGFFNFGDTDVDSAKFPAQGVGLNGDTSHVYQKAGTYRIKQKGGFKNGVDDTVIYVTVLPAQLPQFDIGICEGFKAIFKISDNFYNQYSLVPDPGIPSVAISPSSPYTYTYTDATIKSPSVKGECGLAVTKQFAPIANLIKPDIFSIESIKNGTSSSINIVFNAIPSMKYKLLQKSNSSTFLSIDTINGKAGLTGLTYPAAGDQCYSLVSFDDCGNADTSETLCTNTLTVIAENNQNKVSWTTPPLPSGIIEDYELFRNGISLGTFAENTATFVDTDVLCGKVYTYQIIAKEIFKNTFDGSPLQASSQPVQAIAISKQKPPAILNLNATIEGAQIVLTWDDPLVSVKTFAILKAGNGIDFTSYSTSLTNTFSDQKVDVQNSQYCYKISYTDSCNNVAPDSLVTCPVLLKTVKDIQEKNVSNWTNYLNGSTGNEIYILERLDNNDNVISSNNVNMDTTFTDGTVTAEDLSAKYRVKVLIDGNATIVSYSNIFTIRNDLMLFVPNVFTPNNDGTNDVLLAYGKYFSDFKMSIYNRWGELIFYSEDYKRGWDGNFKGQQSNIDNYIYVITLKNNAGEVVTNKGDFLLLR